MKDKKRFLLKFLKDNNAYISYRHLFYKEKSNHTRMNNDYFFNCAISSPFIWSQTKEGRVFWSNLNREWHKEYEEMLMS